MKCRVMYIRAFWLQTPTPNLPEIQQQQSLSVQYFLFFRASVSLSPLCSPLWPHDLFLLVLWMSMDVLTSLSPPTV